MSPLLPHYLVQTVSSALVAVLLWHYSRLYRQGYLQFWTISFAALTVALAGTMLLVVLRGLGEVPSDDLMLAVAWLTVSAGYLQILALLAGVAQVLQPRRRLPSPIHVLLASVVIGLLLVLPYANAPDGSYQRLGLRFGLRYLLAGLALLAASGLLIRVWRRSQLGLQLVSLCFLIFGIELTVLGGLNMSMVFAHRGGDLLNEFVRWHALLELLIYPAIGLGLVIWLLEQEQARTQRAKLALSQLNRTDPLTGLANADAIQSWAVPPDVDGERPVLAVLSLGLYRQAHPRSAELENDALLQRVGLQLRLLQPAVFQVGRLAGDEFALLWTADMAPASTLQRWCQQLDGVIAKQGSPGRLAMRAGWLRLTPGQAVADALPMASAALDACIQQGQDAVCQFAPEMAERQQARKQIENELLKALEQQQFVPYLQPIVELATERINGFELLARWQHPQRGVLPPSLFIESLTRYQRIDELDLYCLRQACLLLRGSAVLRERQQTLSVNLSVQTLQRPDLVSRVQALLQDYSINPSRLILEVTEQSAMVSLESGRSNLLQLRELGLGLAIDDFGSGYSSLTYLTQLPVNVIKFDRAFIRDLDYSATAQQMLAALVPLCHRLGKRVVAEGVETDEQLQRVREAGFDCAQGYLYAQPLPVDDALRQAATVMPHTAHS